LAAHKLKEKGWEYEMHASFLEIYNELLYRHPGVGAK
jgi:hypothetical protein